MKQQPTNGDRPDPEVAAKTKKRRFTAQYKLRILELADACSEKPGALGELLRREGLYSSHICTWRRQRLEGSLQALQPQKRGPKERNPDPLLEEIERLRLENQRLTRDLSKATTIIDVQKKISELLGSELPRPQISESKS